MYHNIHSTKNISLYHKEWLQSFLNWSVFFVFLLSIGSMFNNLRAMCEKALSPYFVPTLVSFRCNVPGESPRISHLSLFRSIAQHTVMYNQKCFEYYPMLNFQPMQIFKPLINWWIWDQWFPILECFSHLECFSVLEFRDTSFAISNLI